jgi:hypothetical protein
MTTPIKAIDSGNATTSGISFYLEILDRLRNERFNLETNEKLAIHPYLIAAREGKLSIAQRRAFVGEQYSVQYSDACSFAKLAGHGNFRPKSLSVASVPSAPTTISNESSEKSSNDENNEIQPDLFQFLLGGEVYASKFLLDHAKSVGFENEDEGDLRRYKVTAKAQAYPSYWARIALAGNRGAGAAVSFNLIYQSSIFICNSRELTHMPLLLFLKLFNRLVPSISQHGGKCALIY